jgi:DNA-binding transcriptional ArsR family regulator
VSPLERLLELLGSPKSSRELQERLGLSQPTVSRLLKRAGEQVARIGRGPTTCYARATALFDTPRLTLPLFRIDGAGLVEQVATVRALVDGRYLVGPERQERWLLGSSGTGLFDGLPYFLHDLRPAGFLGRQIARRLAAEWGVPVDPRDWSDVEIGRYLLGRGDDLPGNVVVGEAAVDRIEQREVVAMDRGTYPELAEAALRDEAPGSSAAGEQLKFAVFQREAGHVIVKFSPAGTSPEAERWRDLLWAESHALDLIGRQGIDAATATVHDIGGRLFLESKRFDRVGLEGRTAAISLGMVDAEFAGEGHGWARTARALSGRGLLDERDLQRLVWLEAFGGWIGNTDMHLGNISLCPLEKGFGLLPVYDMLPMALAPVRGEIPSHPLRPPVRSAGQEELWLSAGLAAVEYWRGLAEETRISDLFRTTAEQQGSRGEKLIG